MNQEAVLKQREKGLEHVDFRKKEEEAKEQARKAENKAERERQKQIREQRRQEGRKVLGLEMLHEEVIEDYRKRVKDHMATEDNNKPNQIKGAIIAPISQ